AGRRADASRLVAHAIVIALGMAAAFTVVLLGGGRPIYQAMGARAGALEAALAYSNVIFAGAVAVWLFNTLASVVRGTGNMLLPASVVLGGSPILVTLSPALIFGWGPFPRLGVTGAAMAVVAFAPAGFGMGVPLEFLPIPVVFGFGSALVTMVGTNFGAGQDARARRVAWTGAAMAAGVTESIGLVAALFPHGWLALFSAEP